MKYKIFLMLTCIFISACNKRGKEDELSSFLGNKHLCRLSINMQLQQGMTVM